MENQIGDEGAIAIAEALKENFTLSWWLCLMENQIGDEGAKAIAEMLEKNTTLLDLYINYGNPIGGELLDKINEKLKRNQTLNKIINEEPEKINEVLEAEESEDTKNWIIKKAKEIIKMAFQKGVLRTPVYSLKHLALQASLNIKDLEEKLDDDSDRILVIDAITNEMPFDKVKKQLRRWDILNQIPIQNERGGVGRFESDSEPEDERAESDSDSDSDSEPEGFSL
tara:strand:- start:853 stop:1530 length:678 start_codon:yes stop_codon:yes gene_type:complete